MQKHHVDCSATILVANNIQIRFVTSYYFNMAQLTFFIDFFGVAELRYEFIFTRQS